MSDSIVDCFKGEAEYDEDNDDTRIAEVSVAPGCLEEIPTSTGRASQVSNTFL